MEIRIHDGAAFQLDATITHHPICGPTFELFQTYPLAQHPRRQRIVSLTLPVESLALLGYLLTAADSDVTKEGFK